jgi:hypothetical protein
MPIRYTLEQLPLYFMPCNSSINVHLDLLAMLHIDELAGGREYTVKDEAQEVVHQLESCPRNRLVTLQHH